MPILWVIFHFTIACLLMALGNWIGLIPWRRALTAHWTERARLLYPVCMTQRLNIFLLPGGLVLFNAVFAPQPILLLVVYGLFGFLGAMLGCFPFNREILPEIKFGNWCYRVMVGLGIRSGIWLVLIAAIYSMPAQPGLGMALVAIGYLVIHFLIQWGLLHKLLRQLKFFKPPGCRLKQIVDATSVRMSVEVRGLWQIDSLTANAFAFPFSGELGFTDRLLKVCTDDEVAAICAHELAHLTESKTVRIGRLVGSLRNFPIIFIVPLFQYCGVAGIFYSYFGVYLIQLLSRQLSMQMEKRADSQALIEQTAEGVYARALEKLCRANQTPAIIGSNQQTHPELYDRLLKAGIKPDYPRPLAPKRYTVAGWVTVILVVALLLLIGEKMLSD